MPEAVIVSTACSPFGRAMRDSLHDVRGDDLTVLAFKPAGIIDGGYLRHLHGNTEAAGFDSRSEVPELLIASGLKSIKEDS